MAGSTWTGDAAKSLARAGTAVCALLAVGTPAQMIQGQSETPAPVVAHVSGIVFDSLGMRQLDGALVQLVSAAQATRARALTTLEGGAFAFDSVEAGTYLLGFFHPLLDSLGIQAPLVRLTVRTSGDIRIPLAVPSSRTIRTSFCGERALKDSTGVMLGFVRSAVDGLGRARAQIKASWSEITIGAGGVRRVSPEVQGETSDAGGAALCGIPIGGSVLVRAWSGNDSSGFAELEVPSSGVLRRDVFVGLARAESIRAAAPVDSAADSAVAPPMTTVLRGNGVLRGTVRRPDGTPLEGARLVFWGSGVEATTSTSGTFLMQSLPVGTYTLEARALGFLPRKQAVDLTERGEAMADIRMESFGTYLDTVKVRAERVYASRQVQEFEERRRRGFGHFLDEDAIEKRNPIYVSDLVRMTPGITVSQGQFGDRVLMRGFGFQRYCLPAIFLDGMKVMNLDGDLDSFVNAQDIRAMEIYTRAAGMPPQFQTMDGCGSLVIWTGGRRPRSASR